MMKAMNNAITHADLVNAGIIILEQEKEDAFLDAANDIFADLVGTEVINSLGRYQEVFQDESGKMQDDRQHSQEPGDEDPEKQSKTGIDRRTH